MPGNIAGACTTKIWLERMDGYDPPLRRRSNNDLPD
jgi:hypothetical protein